MTHHHQAKDVIDFHQVPKDKDILKHIFSKCIYNEKNTSRAQEGNYQTACVGVDDHDH